MGTADRGGRPDADEQKVEALARAFPAGVFLPRAEQEQRAGGIYSWNTGVDYAALLARSGQEPLIRRLYAKAELDLAADLAQLAREPRISAQPHAVAYMAANYSPTGRPNVPLLAVQALNDPVTSPSLQEGYAAAASPRMVQSLYFLRSGTAISPPNRWSRQSIGSSNALSAMHGQGRHRCMWLSAGALAPAMLSQGENARVRDAVADHRYLPSLALTGKSQRPGVVRPPHPSCS